MVKVVKIIWSRWSMQLRSNSEMVKMGKVKIVNMVRW